MRFLVKGLRNSGGVISVHFDAVDEADAQRQAKLNGLAVLSLRRAMTLNLDLFKRRSSFPLTMFSQELLALLKAGLALVEAVEALAEKESHSSVRLVLDQVSERLRQGRTLSQAMQESPHAFPGLFVATVRATERTGDLPDALERYIAYASQVELVRKKIISASIYPVLLIAVGTIVLIFLVGYVVPRFSAVYEEIRGNVPMMSRLLLKFGSFLQTNALMATLGAVGFAACVVQIASTSTARSWLGSRLWQIPAIGSRLRLYQLARFYRTLGMLLRGGTPVVAALDMSSGLLATVLRPNLARAREAIREGRPISEAMSEHGLTTAVALRMLRVGERTGRMDEMMDRIAGFLDDEIARWVDWFTRLFEPLLMAFIGVVIGAIVILMYMPVFELAGNLQ
jgi:general secretion pathway protein F